MDSGDVLDKEIIKSGIEGFDKMIAEESTGGRPINQKEEHGMKNKDRRRKSSKRKIGSKVAVLMCHFLSLILPMVNLPNG